MEIENSGETIYKGPSEGVYVKRTDGRFARSEPVHEAVLLDFDIEGNLIGVEVLPTLKDLNAAGKDHVSGKSKEPPLKFKSKEPPLK